MNADTPFCDYSSGMHVVGFLITKRVLMLCPLVPHLRVQLGLHKPKKLLTRVQLGLPDAGAPVLYQLYYHSSQPLLRVRCLHP
jgi:hypothetical protein